MTTAPFDPGDKVRPTVGKFRSWLSGSGPGTVVSARYFNNVWFIAVRWPDRGLVTVPSEHLRPAARKRVTA